MTMSVRGPDGVVVNFPDGTDAATIDRVMRDASAGVSRGSAGATAATTRTGPPTPDVGPDEWSFLQSLGMGAGAGTGFNLNDEVAAGVKTGFGMAGDYNAEVAKQRANQDAARKAHPVGYALGEVGGALATAPITVPLRIAKGISAIPRVVNNALSGALYGGAYGAGAGEGVEGRLTGAAQGAGVGGALGGAVGAVLPAGRSLNPFVGFANPDKEAAKRLALAIGKDIRAPSQRDALNTAADSLETMQAAGVPAIAADTGGAWTRSTMRSAANTAPEAREALETATETRFHGQAERTAEKLRHITGASGDTGNVVRILKDAAARANEPLYRKAFSDPAGQALWTPELEQLTVSDIMRKAIKGATSRASNDAAMLGVRPFDNPFVEAADGALTLKTRADGSKAVPSLQFWDAVKRNLDQAYNTAKSSGATEDMRDIQRLRSRLVGDAKNPGILDKAVPSYRDARGSAASFFGAEDALEVGEVLVRDRRWANPEIARELAKMTPAERRLAEEGFANELIRAVSGIGDNVNVPTSSFFDNPTMRERTALVLGNAKAGAIEAHVRVENMLNLARKALGNSTTARQLAELGLAGGRGVANAAIPAAAGMYASGGDIYDPSTILTAALVYGARRGAVKIDQRVAERVGRLLATDDPQKLRDAANLVGRSSSMMGALREADNFITRAILPLLSKEGAGSVTGTVSGRADEHD